jgi:hypothetical protein
MEINEITREIKIERKRLFWLLICATDKPYTAKNDNPKIIIVMVNVINFLQIFWPSVKPILAQITSYG